MPGIYYNSTYGMNNYFYFKFLSIIKNTGTELQV